MTKFSKYLKPIKPPAREDEMTTDDFNAVLDKLSLSSTAAARLLGINDRTARRWTSGAAPIPAPAARFLRFLARAKISPITVMETLAE
jgi:DNA-binding transcriptional regulator YiaG